MTRRGSRRTGLLTALGGAMLLALSACGAPQSQDTMNIHGQNVDEDTRARVDRLVSYCQRLSDAGNFYLSAGMCKRAHDLDPTNPLPLMIMAQNFERYERHEDALQAYGVVLENHPQSVEAAYSLSKLQLAQGYDKQALKTLQASLTHNPNEPKLLNIIGVISDQQGDHEMAQFYYREALAQQPENMSVSNNLGLSLALSGQADEAVRILNDVVASPSAPSTSHSNLALAYAAAEAEAELSTAESEQEQGATIIEDTGPHDLHNEPIESRHLGENTSDQKGYSFNDPLAQEFNQETGKRAENSENRQKSIPLLTSSFAPVSAPHIDDSFDLPVGGQAESIEFGSRFLREGRPFDKR
ncbi:MAG: tetratricopeptide repeat protein [Kiloniellales bacterium]|nr:tetratricopeptide repeat protein [Kiloniellales bacterium]